MQISNGQGKAILGAGMAILGAGLLAAVFTVNAALDRLEQVPELVDDAHELLGDIKQTQEEMGEKWDNFVATMPGTVGVALGETAGTAVETFGAASACDNPEGCEEGNIVGDIIRNVGEQWRERNAGPAPD